MVRNWHSESNPEWLNFFCSTEFGEVCFCFVLQNGCLLCADPLAAAAEHAHISHTDNGLAFIIFIKSDHVSGDRDVI